MFTKDSRTETYLTQMGVDFSYSNNIEFSSLQDGWRGRNQGRPVAVRDDAVMNYASLMESGSPAPAPILHRVGDSYEVLDGLQRLLASELAGTTRITAYVVTTDSPNTVASIRVLSNQRLQGRAESPEWNRRRAVEVLVLDCQMTTKEVAIMGGWKKAELDAVADCLRWSRAVEKIGGPELPNTILEIVARHATMDQISKNPDTASRFFKGIQAAKFAAADAEPFIEEFFKPSPKAITHQTYVERLEEFESSPEVQVRITGRKSASISRDVKLRRSLKTAITVLDELAASREKLLFVDEYFRLLKTIDKKIRAVGDRRPTAEETRTPSDKWVSK